MIYWGGNMYKIYQIQNGDTIDTIARLFNISKDELKRINGIKDNMMLMPGSFIIVPDQVQDDYIDYEVKKGDTMYGISKKYNVDLDTLFELNGLEKDDYIYPNEMIKIPNLMNSIYITKKGETIESLEKKLNTNIENLKNNNEIYLVEDQIIKLN